jgi:inward rectifier potassium channel
MTGIFGVALLTGLFFAKFARPEARVLFARTPVISIYHGKPTLMLRIANERGSHIVEAVAHVAIIREEHSPEGHRMRRIHDLELVRSTQPLFRLSWTLMHIIDERSPLFGYDADRLRREGVRLFVNLMGYDASVGQTAHASATFAIDDFAFGARYKDATREDGDRLVLDFALFHDTVPAPLPAGPLGTPMETTTTTSTP